MWRAGEEGVSGWGWSVGGRGGDGAGWGSQAGEVRAAYARRCSPMASRCRVSTWLEIGWC